MALSIVETFGYRISDKSEIAEFHRTDKLCPFLGRRCWKSFRAGSIVHGTCVVKPPNSEEVIVCPDRLYSENFRVLREVATEAFGSGIELIGPEALADSQGKPNRVVVFGKRWGRELQVPKNADSTGGYSADWILARVDASGKLEEFAPLEIQTMDTSGSYQGEWHRLYNLPLPTGVTIKSSGINWENVNKRIIPQLLTKGNVFGREPLCKKGLFFVCPTPVYERLMGRLGAKLSSWPMRAGALTFRWYSLSASGVPATPRSLVLDGQFTTTVENLKEAFNSILNLPSMGAMGTIIQAALDSAVKKKML